MNTVHTKVTDETLETVRNKMLEAMQMVQAEGASVKEAVEITEGMIIGTALKVYGFEAVTEFAFDRMREVGLSEEHIKTIKEMQKPEWYEN